MGARQPSIDLAIRGAKVRGFEDIANEAARELKALRANLAEAVALLKRVEFGGYEDRYTEFQGRHCPDCGGYMDEITTHESSCELAAFLKRMGAE